MSTPHWCYQFSSPTKGAVCVFPMCIVKVTVSYLVSNNLWRDTLKPRKHPAHQNFPLDLANIKDNSPKQSSLWRLQNAHFLPQPLPFPSHLSVRHSIIRKTPPFSSIHPSSIMEIMKSYFINWVIIHYYLYTDVQIVPDLASGSPSKLAPMSFWQAPFFFFFF